jgi:hypothetical protein
MLASRVSTAEMLSGEMAVDDGEPPVDGVAFGGAAGEQAATIRKIPQIASSLR